MILTPQQAGEQIGIVTRGIAKLAHSEFRPLITALDRLESSHEEQAEEIARLERELGLYRLRSAEGNALQHVLRATMNWDERDPESQARSVTAEEKLAEIRERIAALDAENQLAHSLAGDGPVADVLRESFEKIDGALRLLSEKYGVGDEYMALDRLVAAAAPTKITPEDTPELRHWLGSQDVIGDKTSSQIARAIHALMRAKADISTARVT